MFTKKAIVYFILIIQIFSVFSINIAFANDSIPNWNNNWSFREEINIPIFTDDESAIFQPIDILFEFNNPCWAKNEKQNSIRICSWDGKKWHELESQIYDLGKIDDSNLIKRCGIVFLIPEFADGNERYFVYYDENEKPPANYIDHVQIEDSYYYYEPITSVKAEGDYYKITEDGFCVFGVGQKGKVIHRKLSQTVVKLKPGTKDFDILNSDNIASFCFSYHKGEEYEDEISSDYELVAKQILEDGNLMIEFKIISQSEKGNIRTSNIYKYYYCPTEEKRMNVHVKHEVLEDDYVRGVVNVDGRYGAIISYQSKSEKIEKMRFGEILPYIHVQMEDGGIREYLMNQDPEGKKREWIIPYTDDCDLGKKAWFSYDEGQEGKAQAIILSSNSNIVREGKEDRDGVQMKVAVNEYMNALGAEIDYAAINYGRNSYERDGIHYLKIRNGLVVEYDAEFFISENGGFPSVIKEVDKYHKLIKHRKDYEEEKIEEEQKIHTLTVIPRLSGRILSHPILANITGLKLTSVYAELYKDGELLSVEYAKKPLFGAPKIIFPKLGSGEYLIKIFRDLGKTTTLFIGVEPVQIDGDKTINVFCTWPKNLKAIISDQKENIIKNLNLILYKNETEIDRAIVTNSSDIVFNIPANIFYKYKLKGIYKGFELFSKEIGFFDTEIRETINLYDITVNIFDKLGFPPGVNIEPYLTSSNISDAKEIKPDDSGYGQYKFLNLPPSKYILHVNYGGYSDLTEISLKTSDKEIDVDFNAVFRLDIKILDSSGNKISEEKNIEIYRKNIDVTSELKKNTYVSMPPGKYQIRILSDGKIIGFKDFVLTNDKEVKVVTSIKSKLPLLVNILTLIFIVQMSLLFIFKKISLNTFLKILAMILILISIFQPWWSLDAVNKDLDTTKNTDVYIYSQVMIERITIDSEIHYDLSTVPDMFIDFLYLLLIILVSGFALMGFSFVPNIMFKRRYAKILIVASAIFLLIVSFAFVLGMSKITELSLGSLTGEGNLNVNLPTRENIQMNATWGLGTGFYLSISAALIGFFGGIIDFIKKKFNLKIF